MRPATWNRAASRTSEQQFSEGWYIIDNESLLRQQGDYLYLRHSPHVEQIGYGFRPYGVTSEKAAEFERMQKTQKAAR